MKSAPACDSGLLDFWAVYDAHFDVIIEATGRAAGMHPEFGPALRERPLAATPRAIEQTRELVRQAMRGEPAGYEQQIAATGVYFAERGVSFGAWIELILAFQDAIAPHLVAAYATEPERLTAALRGMHGFAERTLTRLGRAYLDAKEHALEERNLRTEARAAALAASEEAYRLLFDCSPMPMWLYDAETLAFLAVNEAAVRHYGYSREEFLGMNLRDIRPKDSVPALERSLAARRPALTDPDLFRHRKKDGSVIDVSISAHGMQFEGRPARLVLALDTTEQRRLERQLRESQKMEAVGQLAGGIAHDFNNLLTAIISFSKYASESLPPEHAARADIDEVVRAGERAASLTKQLLTFSRKEVREPSVLDLNEIATGAARMLERIIGEQVELRTQLAANLAPVLADRGQIEQVLLNLVVNARDAMPRGGKVTIETENVELDPGQAGGNFELAPGKYVLLAVTDTGVGMDEQTQSRIFEPFFTTKQPGHGTGLGLSTVFGIAKQWGGAIAVYSAPGKGSTFKVYLPCATVRPTTGANEAAEVRGGAETILLVEDDHAVRAVAKRALASAGYQVLDAADPQEALGIGRGPGRRFDLLVTDVVMPRSTGRELAETLTRELPGLKVLFMSGFTGGALLHQGVVDPGMNYIQKPFTPKVLLAKVRGVLDAS